MVRTHALHTNKTMLVRIVVHVGIHRYFLWITRNINKGESKMSKCHYCGESFYLLAKEGFIKKPISVKFRYEDIIETFQFCDEECTECFEQDQYVLNQGY